MSDRSDVMALIGAGPVGLGMAKALLEHKIPYEELEADRELGGNWLHGVYETVHIISSRKTTEYADYPMPVDYPDFPSRQQMLDYLRDYAQKFQLTPHIQFNAKVVMALPLADGRWELELASGEKRIYKGLIVCNGHHWDRRFPKYPGEFAGEFMHSKDYRTPAQLIGQRVLVIGGGNSACDIAAEAARVSKTARISLRRGYWFLPKTLFGNTFGGIDQAMGSSVGAADFLTDDLANCHRKIFGLRFAGAGPQNFRGAPDDQQRTALLHEAREDSAAKRYRLL